MMSSQQVDPSLESEVYNYLLTVVIISIHAPVILREILKQKYYKKYKEPWQDARELLQRDRFKDRLSDPSKKLIRKGKFEHWDPTVLCHFLLHSSHFFLTTRFNIKSKVYLNPTRLVISQFVDELLLDLESECKKVPVTISRHEVYFTHEHFESRDWKKRTYVCDNVRREVKKFLKHRNEVAHSGNGRVSIQKFDEVVRCVNAICKDLQLQFDIRSMLKDQGAILRIEKEMVGSLGLRHLMDIFQILKKFKFPTNKWRDLGEKLGLSKETLEDIKNKYERDDDRLRRCLSKWLQHTVIDDEEVTSSTWVSLHQALNKINQYQVVKELKSCTERACTILDDRCPSCSQFLSDPVTVISDPVTVAEILNVELVLTRKESSNINESWRVNLLLVAVKKAVTINFLSLRTFANVLCKDVHNVNLGKSILSDYEKTFCMVPNYIIHQENFTQLEQSFQRLFGSVYGVIEEKLPLETLKKFLEDYPRVVPLIALSPVRNLLRSQCSMIDITILEEVVQAHTTELNEAERYINEYKDELEKFCQSVLIRDCLEKDFRAFEACPCLQCETATFVLNWEPEKQKLRDIRDIFDRKFGLVVKVVTGNSIVVTCIFDRSLLGSVFANAMENFALLQEKGLIELTVGYYTIRKRKGDKCMYVRTSIVTETVEKDEVIEEIDLLEKFLKQLEIQEGQDDGSTAELKGSIQSEEEMDKDQMMAESDELSLTQSAKRIAPGHESLSEEEELLTEQFSKSSLSEADKLSTLQSEEISDSTAGLKGSIEYKMMQKYQMMQEYQLMKLMSISESDELSSIQSTKRITPGHESLSEKEKPLTEQKLSLSESDKLFTLQSKEIPVSSKAKTAFNTKSEEMVKFLEEEIKHKGDTHLHKHQMEAVLHVRDYYLKHEPGEPAIVVLPIGCGRIGVAILAAYALDVRKVLVITSSKKISEQFYEAFMGEPSFLVEQGIIAEEDWKQLIPTYAQIKQSSEISHELQNDLMIVTAHKLDHEMLHEIPHDNFDLVVVDEAHHYPADTWRVPVDHFKHSKQLFLTPTPFHRGEHLLTEDHVCYELKMKDAADMGIIRPLKFHEIDTEGDVYEEMSHAISAQLDEHDRADCNVTHQAMVLTSSQEEAITFNSVYNRFASNEQRSAVYITGETSFEDSFFKEKKLRVLVSAGMLLKKIDHKSLSVVAIARNVQAHALFTQFIGQAVQKAHPEETIEAVLISHCKYSQRAMYEQLYMGRV